MRRLLRCAVLVIVGLLVLGGAPASAVDDPAVPDPLLPQVPLPDLPGVSDCKDAPSPESPGMGVAGLFTREPAQLPPAADPFAEGSSTTIFEQYGYAGLRWHTYDLGCGPDALRQPDAVIGTAVSNWVTQIPVALTALTGSLTQVAFKPSFLGGFDPVVARVSTALHDSLFANWAPVVLGVLGLSMIAMARRRAFSSTATAAAWALLVLVLATVLFRWPVAAGQVADATVTSTVGEVVGRLDGDPTTTDPGMAVASQVQETIMYRAWLAGTLGDADSATAVKFGPDLFKAQALTWREAAAAESDPERAKEIFEAKQERWMEVADQIKERDPEAYENLRGTRSETRVGYALLSAVATCLSLPFLLLAALLMLGCFMIVRLAVMLFPAFAVLGLFPAASGLVTGIGRTVAAAVVNAILFGVGAGVTVAVLGILFNPGSGSPAWLGLVLMPLFTFVMWQALRPFRRLGSMVNPNGNHLGSVNDSFGRVGRRAKQRGRQLVVASTAALTGGASAGAAAAAASSGAKDTADDPVPRAEAMSAPPVVPAQRKLTDDAAAATSRRAPDTRAPTEQPRPPARSTARVAGVLDAPSASPPVRELPEGFVPRPMSRGVPPPPIEPEWYDGEAVYPIYRPTEKHEHEGADNQAGAR
ncbi:hypothetical protein [Nocardioides aurantiacus]|uniref:TrbL/VirB6 plasmid conjugal transfer protein n=1 Tax=Nocardioides aurantiacus TaxID=86796 RepID=A0A3N2CWB1_9ACTN|nr:hypothetical protein [Nocardioides aurantiacus]ROR91820.1 hypothetical protein EDD33_2696 [Nocardioides aurantiacus]